MNADPGDAEDAGDVGEGAGEPAGYMPAEGSGSALTGGPADGATGASNTAPPVGRANEGPDDGPDDEPRIGALVPLRQDWPLMTVLLVAAVALLVVALGYFRRGSVLLAAAVVLAFFLRLLLTDADAGSLQVRTRAIDLSVLGVLGAGLAVLAFLVPDPS